jgi:hypothetical protein
MQFFLQYGWGWLFFKVTYGILEGPVEIWGIIFESALGGVVEVGRARGALGSALALRSART